MTIALDGSAGTTPSTLHLVGFQATEAFGVVTVTATSGSGSSLTAGQNISIVDNVISCTLVPEVYTGGTNIDIDTNNVISCTLVPEVYTGGTNINIDSNNVVSCTLAPLNVSIDGTNHVPTNLAFVGFSGACLLYTSPSPRDKRQSRMPSSA